MVDSNLNYPGFTFKNLVIFQDKGSSCDRKNKMRRVKKLKTKLE